VITGLYGGGMMLPTVIAIHYETGHILHFSVAGLLVAALGLTMMRAGIKPVHLSHRDGFLIVALAWSLLSILGAIPFWSTGACRTLMDGLFESVSGLTTTGATILSGLDGMPPSILFWRSMQQWFGGMGIIVLAIAILPFLGVGGMQLYRAEMPGMTKDKLTSRMTQTGKVLWFIYLGLTAVMALSLWLAGMGAFDAVNHAMCTVSTGGFSTHDASFGFYPSPLIRTLVTAFMFISGINFALHFLVLKKGGSLNAYTTDSELRAYVVWILIVVLLLASLKLAFGQSVNGVLFTAISIITTTGFTVVDYGQWPAATMLVLFAAMFIGGCAGSTAGGMKVIRALLLFRQGLREIRRLIRPHGVIPVKLGGQILPASAAEALWGFFTLYLVCYGFISFLVMLTGVDALDALSATAACMGNVGPGFGHVGPAANYAGLPDAAKGLLAFGMILGRLEIFTLFVLLAPDFWRK
jgi:Trk-type K+ transport systems, membrane components